MNFSWLKDNSICIETLIKKWNDNFCIFEHIDTKVTGKEFYFVRVDPSYVLSVYRNKTFFTFNLGKEEANYLIYKLDLKTMLSPMHSGYQRRFFNKSAYGKVMMGYKWPNVEKFIWERAYG